ncbi:tetratricopeptide repeat protein [Clostridium sp.]
MLVNYNEKKYFHNNVKEVISAIKSNKYDLAYKCLKLAMFENDHSAEVYNLLGIISEYKGDVCLACKYYGVALVFDPTYKPSDNNLEKLTSFFYIFNEENIDYGDNIEKDNQNSYFIEYNVMNVGHLKKNDEFKSQHAI